MISVGRLLVIAGAVLAGAVGPVAAQAPLAAVPPLAAGTPLAAQSGSGNLLVDGGAERAQCTTDLEAATTDPGWMIRSGSPNAVCYRGRSVRRPVAGRGGNAFFGPGPYGHSASMRQITDIAPVARAVDAGSVQLRLAGWLGGTAARRGEARVSVTFLGAKGRPLGHRLALRPVTAAQRHDRTELLQRRASTTVPRGTRRLATTVSFAHTGGAIGYSQRGRESGWADSLSVWLSVPLRVPKLRAPPSRVPRFAHVFMIMMENTDGTKVLGRGNDMPFLDRLRRRGTVFTDYHAVYHPSDENYLAIAGGDTYAHGAVYWPHINDPARNIADELQRAGKTWKAYEQGMGPACNLSRKTEHEADPYYAPDDTPFSSYTDISRNRRRCRHHLVDSNELPTDLRRARTTPAFSWIAADDYYDGESAGNGTARSRRVQDSWLDETITPILQSRAWHRQRSLLIITWDETAAESGNRVAAFVVGSRHTVRAGTRSSARTDHYSTGRTIEDALGIRPITPNDRYATPLNPAFHS